MKVVFDASNTLEAHMIKGVLTMYEIVAYIQGEYLEGGAGELPMIGCVKVCTSDDDCWRAKELINEWQTNKLMPKEWKVNESDFNESTSTLGLALSN